MRKKLFSARMRHQIEQLRCSQKRKDNLVPHKHSSKSNDNFTPQKFWGIHKTKKTYCEMDDKKKQWMRLSLAICDGGGAQNDFFLFAFVLHAGAAAAESFLRDILGNKTPVFCSLFAISFFLCKLGFFLARVTNPKKRFYRQPITVEIAFNSFPDLALDRFFIPSKLQECWLWIGSNLFFFLPRPIKVPVVSQDPKKDTEHFFLFLPRERKEWFIRLHFCADSIPNQEEALTTTSYSFSYTRILPLKIIHFAKPQIRRGLAQHTLSLFCGAHFAKRAP